MDYILHGACHSLHVFHFETIGAQVPPWLNSYTFFCMCSLREIYYYGRATQVFDILGKNNRALETVEICADLSGRSEEFCLHVVESFACCRKLRELVVSTSEGIAESEEASVDDSDSDEDVDLDDHFVGEAADVSDMELDSETEAMNEKTNSVQDVCNNYCMSSTNRYVILYGFQYLPIRRKNYFPWKRSVASACHCLPN